MADWEDWGLAICIPAALLGCCVFMFVKPYRNNNVQEPLLDNPV